MSNEAAERLRITAYLDHTYDSQGEPWSLLLDAALAAERKATVERIRAAYEIEDPYAWEDEKNLGGRVSEEKLLTILDAEAAR